MIVSEVMTRDAISVQPKTKITDAVRIMLASRVSDLPVLEDSRLVGVIGRADLLRALASKLAQTPDEARDEQILIFIRNEIAKTNWASKSDLCLVAKDKVVTLEGTFFSDEERRGLITIAENAPCIREVKDEPVFVDPDFGLAFPTASL